MWPIFLALHLIGFTGYNLVLRKALVDKADRWTLATVMQIGISIPMMVALFIAPPDPGIYDLKSVAGILIASVIVVLLHLTNVKALQYLEASVYSVLYNLRILFTTIIGVFLLHEKVILLQIIGGLLIFLAVLTVRQKGRHDITTRGIQWGIAAAVTISVLNFFDKELINQLGYLGYAIPVMILPTIFMITITLIRRQRIPLKVFMEPRMVALMVLRDFSAFGFSLAFFTGGTLSVSTYVSSLGVITTVLFGILLLKEQDNLRQKMIATSLAVVGLTLILIAHLR